MGNVVTLSYVSYDTAAGVFKFLPAPVADVGGPYTVTLTASLSDVPITPVTYNFNMVISSNPNLINLCKERTPQFSSLAQGTATTIRQN